MEVTENVFGEIDGKMVKSYTVMNGAGMEFTCIEYGCIITKIIVPDKDGVKENVVIGFDTIEEYKDHPQYFGAVIGRTSGRIKNAAFTLDGKAYTLAKNEGGNSLHGGVDGFHNLVWDSSYESNSKGVHITFTYKSQDGEEGFPGELDMQVIYTINDANELIISYRGISDKKTIVNVTNHSYFNLSGNLKRTVLSHELMVKSDQFLELDSTFIPTGRAISVENTVFDFRKGKQVGDGLDSNDPQIELVGGGYDHPFLLTTNNQNEICLRDPESGRMIQVETDEPCVVVYSGNSLETDFQIRGVQSQKHLGICLETQAPPNMINTPGFPSAILEVNEVYSTRTKYTFALIGKK